MPTKHIATILWCCTCVVSPGFAELIPGGNLNSEVEFFVDVPSINSVTRLPQRKSDTPAAVTVITRDMIRASGVRYLHDVFRLIPGFQIAHASQERPIVTYHGLGNISAKRILVLVDGRAAYSAALATVDWHSIGISLEDIDHIEVIRGPNTVTYGDNAFLATIDIITRHSATTQRGALSITEGNNDIGDGFARFSNHYNNIDFRVSAGYLSDDGFNDHDAMISRHVNFRSDIHASQNDDILVQFGATRNDHEFGEDDNKITPPSVKERASRFGQLRWTHTLSSNNSVSAHIYRNELSTDSHYTTEPFNAGPLGVIQVDRSIDNEEKRLDFEIEHQFHFNEYLRMVWGAGMREDQVRSPPNLNTTSTLKNKSSRIFASTEWRPKNTLLINGGVMWEKNELTGADISPRIALNYHLNDNHTLRTSWTRAQRIPSLGEEYADKRFTYLDNLLDHEIADTFTLENETIDTFEVGYLASIPKMKTSLDLRLFHDDIKHYITHVLVVAPAMRDNQAIAFRNEGDVVVYGMEFDVTYQPTRDTRISLNHTFMNAKAENFSDASVYTDRHIEATVPDYSGSLFAFTRFTPRLHASLGYYWVDKMLWLRQTENRKHRRVDLYTRLDMRISYLFDLANVNGEVALVAQNLGDDYQDFNANQLFEQRVYLSLKLEL